VSRDEEVVFGYIWKSLAPSNAVAFSWTLLLDRVPTWTNLAKRRIMGEDMSTNCPLCNGVEETTNHLFLHCDL